MFFAGSLTKSPHQPVVSLKKKYLMRITDLLHYRWRSEPGVLLQDRFWEVFSQPGEVAVPDVRQILAVINAHGLIPHYEAFNEPR